MIAEARDLELTSGRVRLERSGPRESPLVLCVHGLSATLRGFDRVGAGLVRGGRDVVAYDLRGRGRSDVTPPGSYGLEAHARDVLEIADALGADTFDYVGWSLGALIGIRVAGLAPGRVGRIVLVDHAGAIDPGPAEAIRTGLGRLDAEVPDPEAYLEIMRARAPVTWDPFWAAYFRYELAKHTDGTWSPSTDRAACEEDVAAVPAPPVLREGWRALTMPALLVRCTVALAGGLIVPHAELDAFRAAVPAATVVESAVNHYDVMTDARATDAIAAHLA